MAQGSTVARMAPQGKSKFAVKKLTVTFDVVEKVCLWLCTMQVHGWERDVDSDGVGTGTGMSEMDYVSGRARCSDRVLCAP